LTSTLAGGEWSASRPRPLVHCWFTVNGRSACKLHTPPLLSISCLFSISSRSLFMCVSLSHISSVLSCFYQFQNWRLFLLPFIQYIIRTVLTGLHCLSIYLIPTVRHSLVSTPNPFSPISDVSK
jgi:hypothetical protein